MLKLARLIPLALTGLLAGCAATATLDEAARDVRVLYAVSPPTDCRFIADVIGSEGHWYNYLFIANDDLSMGAITDIKNRTQALGGNTVRVVDNREFTTSVTLIGQVYDCARPD